jgi:hypothetical protein
MLVRDHPPGRVDLVRRPRAPPRTRRRSLSQTGVGGLTFGLCSPYTSCGQSNGGFVVEVTWTGPAGDFQLTSPGSIADDAGRRLDRGRPSIDDEGQMEQPDSVMRARDSAGHVNGGTTWPTWSRDAGATAGRSLTTDIDVTRVATWSGVDRSRTEPIASATGGRRDGRDARGRPAREWDRSRLAR